MNLMENNLPKTDNQNILPAVEQAATLISQATVLGKRGEFDAAFRIIEQALEFAKIAQNTSQIAHCLNIHGIIFRNKGNYSKAIEYFNKSLYLYEQIDSNQGIATALGNIGVCYRNISDYSKSLEYFKRALAIGENLDTRETLSNIYGNIGNVYRNLEDYEQALEYYQRSLEIGEETHDIPNIERQLGNIGNAYSNLKQFDLALEHQYKALKLSYDLASKSGIMTHLGNIGNIFVELGRYAEAMDLFTQALSIANEINDKSSIAEWTELCGFIYSQNDYEEYNQKVAEKYFLTALELIQELGNKSKEFHLHKSLAELYKHQERWVEFAVHYEKYHELERKVQGLEAQKAVDRFTHEREIAITTREQAILARKNTELEEANLFKTKLLGIAAHDLKNPLSNIIGASKLVLGELSKDDEHYEWLWIIEQSASRMAALINELLESSAASLGAMEFVPSIFNLGEMLHHVCELNSGALQNKNQKFDIQIHSEIIVSGDQAKLFQVFDNVISNAIKYSPLNATVNISLTFHNSSVRLIVQDEGQGLSQEDLSKLFGQFQRLSSVPTGGESSTGLGLHISKHIVDLHKGEIWAESEGKGKGTTFYVELPIE